MLHIFSAFPIVCLVNQSFWFKVHFHYNYFNIKDKYFFHYLSNWNIALTLEAPRSLHMVLHFQSHTNVYAICGNYIAFSHKMYQSWKSDIHANLWLEVKHHVGRSSSTNQAKKIVSNGKNLLCFNSLIKRLMDTNK